MSSFVFDRIEIEASFRRSRLRLRVLLALALVGSASLAQLAELARVDHRTLRGILVGDAPDYKAAAALVTLGLARIEVRHGRKVVSITPEGRAWAESGRFAVEAARAASAALS